MICTKSEAFDLITDSEPMLEYDLDAGIITWASRSLEVLFGYPDTGVFVGKSLDMLVPEAKREIHQEHIKKYTLHPETRATNLIGLQGQKLDGTIFNISIKLCSGWAGSMTTRRRIVIALVNPL